MNAKMIDAIAILIQAAHELCDYLDVTVWVSLIIVGERDRLHWWRSCSIQFGRLPREHEDLIIV